MPIQIEINDAHIDALIDFYIMRLKTLREEIAEREKESKDINAQILRLKRGKSNPASGDSKNVDLLQPVNYSEKWPWGKKIRFAIERKGQPLTTKEIVDTLIEFEIALMFDRKKAVASISSLLSTKSGDDKEFKRIESDSGDFAYDINKKEEEIEEEEDINPFE